MNPACNCHSKQLVRRVCVEMAVRGIKKEGRKQRNMPDILENQRQSKPLSRWVNEMMNYNESRY